VLRNTLAGSKTVVSISRDATVVGVIRGVADIVDDNCLLWTGSGIHGVRYLMVISYFSMSQCATWLARESKVCLGRAMTGHFNPQFLHAHWSGPELCGFFKEEEFGVFIEN